MAHPANGLVANSKSSGGVPTYGSSSSASASSSSSDADLLSVMAMRLKSLETSQRVMQLELKEKSRRVIELEDKLNASEEIRRRDSIAKRELQKELGEMLLFLTDHGLTWDGSYDGGDGHEHHQKKEENHTTSSGSLEVLAEAVVDDGARRSNGEAVATDTRDLDAGLPEAASRKTKAPALSLLYEGNFAMPSSSAERDAVEEKEKERVRYNPSAGNSVASSAPPSARSSSRLLSKVPVGVGVPITPALSKELTPKKSGGGGGGRRRSSSASNGVEDNTSNNNALCNADGEEDDDGLPFDLELLKRNCLILSDHVGSQAFIGEGHQRVLKERNKVFLCIYSDGICVNSGPFRPYGWALCDAFLNDILEGYYPYEFKDRYPDGFPVEVVDRSTEKCPGNGQLANASTNNTNNHNKKDVPPSGGRKLGGNSTNLVNNARPSNHRAVTSTSPSVSPSSPPPPAVDSHISTLADKKKDEGTFKPLTRDEFLKRLPERYISAGGKLVNVRAGVEELGRPDDTLAAKGRPLGEGVNKPRATAYVPIRSNVDKLLQQAAENKRYDELIRLRKERESDGREGEAKGDGLHVLPHAETSASGETKGHGDVFERHTLVVSAQGEVVGTGGTAPANANFFKTINGQTAADAELVRRHAAATSSAVTSPTSPPQPTSDLNSPRIVTIQIRMPQGQRCVLNMFETDTVADVRSEFERAVPDFFRGSGPPSTMYELTCAFPRKVCSDHSASLELLGLYPNATLLVRMSGPGVYV